ncbi:DUF4136 domain-containing protein [Pseudomonas sp. CrR25]|nr:DUF4136 domain-containing protein [Pseudomonas sp. CrR25]
MRLFTVVLLCLGLATCTSQVPQVQVLSLGDQELFGLRGYELVAPEPSLEGTLPFPTEYRQLPQLLRRGLSARGYHESRQPELRVYYWLAVRDAPLAFKVDPAPPTPLGPYQAIHLLRDETGTLRVRLTDLGGRRLWEGLVNTGLSPARDSAELLERAAQALTERIPSAR